MAPFGGSPLIGRLRIGRTPAPGFAAGGWTLAAFPVYGRGMWLSSGDLGHGDRAVLAGGLAGGRTAPEDAVSPQPARNDAGIERTDEAAVEDQDPTSTASAAAIREPRSAVG